MEQIVPLVSRIHIRKEAYKFSSAHMTVFPDGKKEALHGHNYFVELTVEQIAPDASEMIPFSDLKKILKKLCRAWDEKVLIASKSPYFKIARQNQESVGFSVCGKRYLLPADEVAFLPIENITCELLTQEFCKRFVQHLPSSFAFKSISHIEIRIEESPGQGASFRFETRRKS